MKKVLIFIVVVFVLSFSLAAPFTGVLKEDSSLPDVKKQEVDFDLEIEDYEIYRIWDFSFRMNFDLLLEEKTSFDLDYIVLDSSGELVYFEEEAIIIEESQLVERNLDTRKAQELDLNSGEYSFILRIDFEGEENSFTEKFSIDKISDLLYSLKQLFDIKMEIDNKIVSDSKDLEARVIFENFGEEVTPANLTFIIFDERDEEVYRVEREVVVETEEIVRESFDDLDLEFGEYKLVLRTLYNVNVVDYFEEDFEVREKENYWFLVIFGVIFVWGIYYVLRERFKNHNLKRNK